MLTRQKHGSINLRQVARYDDHVARTPENVALHTVDEVLPKFKVASEIQPVPPHHPGFDKHHTVGRDHRWEAGAKRRRRVAVLALAVNNVGIDRTNQSYERRYVKNSQSNRNQMANIQPD